MKKFFQKNKGIFLTRILPIQSWYDFMLTIPVGEKMNKVVRHPIIWGSGIIFLGSIIGNICNFLFNLFMSRNLSFPEYGTLASLSSLMMLSALPVGSVLPMIVYFSASYFAKGELDMVRGLYRKVTIPFSFIGILLFIIFFVFSNQIATFFQIQEVSYIVLISIMVLLSFVSVANYPLLQAKLAFGYIVSINSLSAFLKLSLSIVLVLLGYSIGGIMWAFIISAIIPYFLSFFPLRFLFSSKVTNPDISLGKIFFYGAPAAVSTFGLTSLITTDIVLVKHFFNPEAAGTYAVLSLAARVIYYFSAPVASVMFPLLVQKHTKGENFHNDLKISLFLVFVCSVAILTFYILFPSFVINIFSRKPVAPSVVSLLIPFGVFISLYGLVAVLTNFYLSINKIKVFIPLLLGSVLQVVLVALFHETLFQVIIISLSITALLLIVLLLYYFKLYGKISKR